MMTVGLGAVVNIVLDPIFIFWLDLGVQGAAWATVIAQGCSAVWVLVFLTGRKAALRLRPRYMVLKPARVRKIVSLGLSGFFMNLTNSLVQVVCNATLQVYGGDLYVGVMTIINSLREVFMMPIHGLSNGAQPVTGYNYGAGLYSRVRQSIRFSVAGTVGCAALFWAAAMVFPGALIRIFNGDAEMLAAGVPAMRIYFCLFIPMSLQMAGQGVFVSLGRSRQAIFFSLLRKAVINAPLTVLLPVWLGTDGVFVAEAVSQLWGGWPVSSPCIGRYTAPSAVCRTGRGDAKRTERTAEKLSSFAVKNGRQRCCRPDWMFLRSWGLCPGHIFCLGPGVPARAVFREDRYNDLVLTFGTATA